MNRNIANIAFCVLRTDAQKRKRIKFVISGQACAALSCKHVKGALRRTCGSMAGRAQMVIQKRNSPPLGLSQNDQSRSREATPFKYKNQGKRNKPSS